MKYWLIALYKTNEISRVKKNLDSQKFEYYSPVIHIKNNNSNTREELLFPGYIFIKTSLNRYSALKYTMGVKKILKFGDNISKMNDDEINKIRIIENASRSDPIVSNIKIGQDAVIANGSFKGSMVKICSLPHKERVEILLTLLGSARRIVMFQKDLSF